LMPLYVDAGAPEWQEVAERLLMLFREREGVTRGELEEEFKENFGDDPQQLVHQGLAKLLEDRCEFEVVSGHPPERLRAAAFAAAAEQRKNTLPAGTDDPLAALAPFDRDAVVRRVAGELGLSAEAIDGGLFA